MSFLCFDDTFSFLLLMLCSCGQAISQSKKNFSFYSNVKSGRLLVILFRRRYSKSCINFFLPFPNMFLRFHFSLYQIDSLPMSFFAFTHSSVNIINPLLCLVRYSFDVSTVHPVNKWLIVSLYFPYSLHRLRFHGKLRTIFQALVFAIFSNLFMITALFVGSSL